MSTHTYTDCDACGTRYQIPREKLGRVLRCRQCGHEFETHEVVAAPLVPPPVQHAPPARPTSPAPERRQEPPTFVVVPVVKNETFWNRNRGCGDLVLFAVFYPFLIWLFVFIYKSVLGWLFPDTWGRL